MHKFIFSVSLSLLVTACSTHRIDKDGSLTVKLREGFAEHYSVEDTNITHPQKNAHLAWQYEPNREKKKHRDRKTENGKEAFKNAADDMGEEILGQIFVSLFEFIIKGSVELVGSAVQAGINNLSADEVVLLIKSDNGEFSKVASEGFNRWQLSNSEKAVLQKPWRIDLWSIKTYKFAIKTALVEELSLDSASFVEVELLKDGAIVINNKIKIDLSQEYALQRRQPQASNIPVPRGKPQGGSLPR